MKSLADIKICAIIPVYRHEATVKAVAESVLANGISVIIVDDGNTEDARMTLRAIAAELPSTILVSNKINGGKGKAMLTGFKAAIDAGFTHALQIDADGQHNAEAIPFFVKAARKHPESMICGLPRYDQDIPKSREQGRKITNFWVAIETLSKDIPDSMCGFRIYPLNATARLLKKIHSFRMGFDIEILVKLHWKGTPINFYPIHVCYPENGISNFRMIRDNIEISLMHTRLCIGMFFRLPKLLFRKIKKNEF